MNVYSSKEAVEFAKKALESGVVAHIVNGYFRPLKDNVILPNGDVYDIGSRFQVIGAVESVVTEIVETPTAEVKETVVEAPAEVTEEAVKETVVEAPAEVKEEAVKDAPVAKTTRARKTAK